MLVAVAVVGLIVQLLHQAQAVLVVVRQVVLLEAKAVIRFQMMQVLIQAVVQVAQDLVMVLELVQREQVAQV
jgi:hypothetical protein